MDFIFYTSSIYSSLRKNLSYKQIQPHIQDEQ